MLIEPRSATDPELTALVIAQQRELIEAEGGPDVLVYRVHRDARFLVGVHDDRPVACGAVQALDGETAELKRMYVCPEYRGRGLARQLLSGLEEYAAAAGYRLVVLETGSYLPAALGLYRSAGYHVVPAYGEYVGNPYSVCFAKRLPRPAATVAAAAASAAVARAVGAGPG